MKKFFALLISLCLFTAVSFADFNPYADDEIEEKSNKKLYYGIILTLAGAFLTYDGFSKVEEDISRPSVDYTTVLHSEWDQNYEADQTYNLRSGFSPYQYKPKGATEPIDIEPNIIYNNGNVDLYNVTIEVRYKYASGAVSDYHVANYGTDTYENKTLVKGQALKWKDYWEYTTAGTTSPAGEQRTIDPQAESPKGLNLGTNALDLMDIRVVLNKNQQYKPIYKKKNKSDIEGVCGVLMCAAGIYFIVDHFLNMHKFNVYAKRHNLNLKIASAPNEYKLLLQKRI